MKKVRDFDFSADKNKKLLADRGIGFEQVIHELKANKELDIVKHPNKDKYPDQKVFIVEIEKYVYAVPFIQKGDCYFLKTIFPSRKLTKKYLFETTKK